MNSAILLIGSNIDPLENTRGAMALLRGKAEIIAISRIWEIPSMGSPGPNYINFAVEMRTPLTASEIKKQVIGNIETDLKRVRSSDKNAPRTIDIDIIMFNNELLDQEIWDRPYIALPVSDLLPQLQQPQDGRKLHEIAPKLMRLVNAVIRSDISVS